jgi:hypothetical protein
MIKKFELFNNKKVLILHGLGGEPSKEKSDIFEKRGYEVIFPHIDYIQEWNKDKCKSIFNYLIKISKNIDLIVGQSLGGYTGFLLSNILNVKTILINPALDRNKTKLDIKNFDIDYSIKYQNKNIEIYFGELDNLIPMKITQNFLKENNLNYKQVIIPNMEHRSPAKKIEEILNISNYIKR